MERMNTSNPKYPIIHIMKLVPHYLEGL